jgi:hypothetical protein
MKQSQRSATSTTMTGQAIIIEKNKCQQLMPITAFLPLFLVLFQCIPWYVDSFDAFV